ncbi:MAG: UDP-N-acetylmuramoyl-tripeptide--D-alanyl-D-alanine ligase [Bacillota bacterium]|nr:UDP-N-acetylmuramoyl-tripeptide--D-alanyl-D-alanine ligase [Bacillota bacterium]
MIQHVLWGVIAVAAIITVLSGFLGDLHAFQQFGYYRAPFFRWKNKQRFFADELLYYLALGLALVASLPVTAIAALLILIHLLFRRMIVKAYPPKKPLAYTGRIKRMLGTMLLIFFAGMTLYCVAPWALVIWLAFAFLCGDGFVLAADGINRPMELLINERFYRDAQRKVSRAPFLKVIAITGSYGKTSTKNVVASMLAPYRNTLASPASYNTKLGLTRTIRESLIPTTEVFVAEMGAKRLGEIEEIVDFLTPDLAIVTSIGEQHLETFRSLDNIVKEKSEVFQKLRSGGYAFINEEDPSLASLTLRSDVHRVSYSFRETSDFYLTDVVTSGEGSSCIFVDRKRGTRTKLWTTLLGKHNLLNILAGAAIATTIGVKPEEIAAVVTTLKPVTNRLSTRKEGDILILEDAFNSNPIGAKAALDVLQSLATNGKRIIMTPGMIELAEKEYAVHFHFGQQIAAVCDYVILVSERQTRHIREGLAASGYDMNRVQVVPTMSAAFQAMRSVASAGDVVLIENDLPDAFEEKK